MLWFCSAQSLGADRLQQVDARGSPYVARQPCCRRDQFAREEDARERRLEREWRGHGAIGVELRAEREERTTADTVLVERAKRLPAERRNRGQIDAQVLRDRGENRVVVDRCTR